MRHRNKLRNGRTVVSIILVQHREWLKGSREVRIWGRSHTP
jgi:hypothetical protein